MCKNEQFIYINIGLQYNTPGPLDLYVTLVEILQNIMYKVNMNKCLALNELYCTTFTSLL